MSSELIEMKRLWKELGIEGYFPQVHHYSSPKFKSDASTLQKFFNWCKGKEIMKENSQTVNRANAVAQSYKNGTDLSKSIKSAWEAYPLVMR